MASELRTKLNNILTEKDTKIIPENIKKDVQIFDVVGTYEGSGGTGPMTQEEYDTCVSLMNNFLGDTPIIEDPYVTVINNFNIDENENLSVEDNTLKIDNELPYVELEYIQSNGTQYINTECGITNNTGFYLQMISYSEGGEDDWGDYLGGGHYIAAEEPVGWKTRFWLSSYGDGNITNGTGSVPDTGLNSQTKIEVELKNGVYTKADGSTANVSILANEENVPIYLFSSYQSSKSELRNPCTKLKLFSAKIYNGSITLRDFIPVQRTSDGKVCLYDKITNRFFLNQGTGEFIAGPEKNSGIEQDNEEDNEPIEEWEDEW